jgi:ABC-type phosphate transport system permease subunit
VGGQPKTPIVPSIVYGFYALFQKIPIITPKNEPFSEERHSKIPLLSWGLTLSNSKRGCAVSDAVTKRFGSRLFIPLHVIFAIEVFFFFLESFSN